MKKYLLDACALIAFLSDEEGAELVENLLQQASDQQISISIHKINLLEIYYGLYRDESHAKAKTILKLIQQLPVHIISDLSDKVFEIAGRIKANYRLSLADSIFIAQGTHDKCILVTSDHHEFDEIEKSEKIVFKWIR